MRLRWWSWRVMSCIGHICWSRLYYQLQWTLLMTRLVVLGYSANMTTYFPKSLWVKSKSISGGWWIFWCAGFWMDDWDGLSDMWMMYKRWEMIANETLVMPLVVRGVVWKQPNFFIQKYKKIYINIYIKIWWAKSPISNDFFLYL